MICTYQDYSEEEEIETSALEEKMDQESNEQIVFPVKLHNMLNQVEKQGLTHVVGWAPHGRCFLIRNKPEFVSRILASWFRQSKFASFQRQLNLYGFKRITTGPDKGGYYHELFLRSKVFLCNRIERVKIKGSKPGRIKAYADAEPDFYRMKAMPAEDGTPAPLLDVQNPPTAPALGANSTGPARRTQSPTAVQPATMASALLDPSITRRGLSFLSEQPQPMAIKRNSPPPSEEEKQGPNGSPLPQAPEPSFFSILDREATTNYSTLLQATFKDSVGPPTSASFLRSTNIHPMLQSSGMSNLVNLRQSPQGIFGNSLASMPAHPSTTIVPSQPQPQPQHLIQNQPPRIAPLSAFAEETQLPSLALGTDEMALSQALPTAQALALEDLFDNNDSHSQVEAPSSLGQPQQLQLIANNIFLTTTMQQQQHLPQPQHNQLQLQQFMPPPNRPQVDDTTPFNWSFFDQHFRDDDRDDDQDHGRNEEPV